MRKIIIVFIAFIFTVILYSNKICLAEIVLPIEGKEIYSTASWYGPNFHGMETASGETFDMYDYTCAHKDYPFGLWLKVTNTSNNKTTFCLVNDRGPYIEGRDLDLSYAAAKEIKMIKKGICAVMIEYVGMDTHYVRDIIESYRHYSLIKAS